MKQSCSASELQIEGIPSVRMENEWIQATILVGKGTDVWGLVYKPLNLDVLMKTTQGLAPLRGRDLRSNRLHHYAESYYGGWQDIIPNRALFRGGEVDGKHEGESAGLPWEYELIRNDPQEILLRCKISLPYAPLDIEKVFQIRSGEPKLRIYEQVMNRHTGTVHFIWTHHPAFGAPFIDESIKIVLPADCKAFNVQNYENNRDEDLSAFLEEVTSVKLHDGSRKNLLEVPPPQLEGKGYYMPLTGLNQSIARIYNPRINLGVALSWDKSVFTSLRYWFSSNENLYTLALEPSSSIFSDIHDCIRHSNCITLKCGEQQRAWVSIGFEGGF